MCGSDEGAQGGKYGYCCWMSWAVSHLAAGAGLKHVIRIGLRGFVVVVAQGWFSISTYLQARYQAGSHPSTTLQRKYELDSVCNPRWPSLIKEIQVGISSHRPFVPVSSFAASE